MYDLQSIEALVNSDTFIRINHVSDELTLKIPSTLLLLELIFFPIIGTPDPFNVEPYRIRPQKIDEESIGNLISRSNEIVAGVLWERLHNPTDLDLVCKQYCGDDDTLYLPFQYRNLLDEYINQLLPRANTNIDTLSKSITILSEINSKEIDDIDSYVKQKYPDIWKEVSKVQRHQESHRRRFTEYRSADDLYVKYHAKSLQNGLLNSYEENAGNVQRQQERKKRLRASEGKGFGGYSNVKNQKKSRNNNKSNTKYGEHLFVSSHHDTNIVMKMEDLISMVRDTKGLTGNFDSENKNIVVTDHRILTQCLFCNRFHLQEPKRILSRYCGDPDGECGRSEKRWRDSLVRKGIDIETVSPSGF
jgi:hypothetical protein